MAACPAGVDIRGNHYLIQQGNLDEAARNYLAVQPFPPITGRVCFHPCESACARARVDSAVNINAVEHVLGDWAAQMPLEKPVRRHISKVAVVGVGMKTHSGLAARFFEALSDKGINVLMISTSEIRIAALVPLDQLNEAVKALHTPYGLDADQVEAVVYGGTGR